MIASIDSVSLIFQSIRIFDCHGKVTEQDIEFNERLYYNYYQTIPAKINIHPTKLQRRLAPFSFSNRSSELSSEIFLLTR